MTQTIIKVPAVGGGSFDPTDIEITDDTSGALLIKEGSNEYMRIDTTNGSEQIVLKGRPGSAANAKLVMSDQPFLQGSDQQNIQMTSSGIFANVSGISGKRFQIRASGTNQFFEVQRTGNVPGLRQDADSTFTYTLDASGAVFKVQDDAGTPNEFLKIDSDPTASLIEFNVPANQGAGMTVNLPADSGSNTGFQLLVPSSAGHLKFGRQASGIYSGGTGFELDVGGGKNFIFNGAQVRMRTSSTPIEFNLNDPSGGSVKITDADDNEIFKVEEDSSLTHTLDDASGAVFKVVDDGASPYTYLSATEGENCVRMNALRTDSTGALKFQNNTGGLLFEIYQNNYIQQYVKPKDSKTRIGLTGSGASQSHTIDFRLGNTKGVQHLQINHGYSGTQTVTLNFNNTLSYFPGNQDWGVNSLLVLVENLTTGQDVTFQIRETNGGTTTFIDHTGASLSDPTGSGSLTLKNVGAASGKNFITFRVSQFNNNQGSASIFDDDRYIVEALTAELY